MDCIVHGVAKSQTRLSDFHFHFCVCVCVYISLICVCVCVYIFILIYSLSPSFLALLLSHGSPSLWKDSLSATY